jgi:phosphatidylglycerophosphate synthase
MSGGGQAEIDGRCADGELPATAIVGGIPLAVRPLRQLARLGWTRARVVVNDAAAVRALHAALARYPVALTVEVVTRSAPSDLQLDGRAIYPQSALAAPPAPEPLLRVRTRADAARAEALLYAQIRKSVAQDGFIAHHLIRPLTRPLTRALLATRVSPNQVTALALAAGLAAAVFAALGGYSSTAIAGGLYWLGNALDCVDGDLARLRLQSSKLGEWLDSMTDEISTFSLLAGLGVGLYRDGAPPLWLAVGVGGSLIGALTVARLYLDLHRMGLPIDSAQFPWWFSKPASAEPEPEPRSRLGSLAHGFTYLIRRDANVTGVALLLVLDLRRVAISLVALGAAIGAAVTIAHYVITYSRRRGHRQEPDQPHP